jgi:methionyl-tRNA formyltransferase
LEGKNEIPITLFEATEKVDSGGIYLKDMIYLEGHELVDEVREKQGKKTIELILKFIDNYPNNPIIAQQGESSYYPKRSPQDSELDIFKTIDEQFNLLRVCDNDRYPAFFVRNGIKYILRIEKDRS